MCLYLAEINEQLYCCCRKNNVYLRPQTTHRKPYKRNIALTDHYILGLLVILAAINLIAAIRHKYIKKAKAIDEDIANLYESKSTDSFSQAHERLEQERDRAFIDIETILEHSFNDHVISGTEEKQFTNQFQDVFSEAYSLRKKLEFFRIEPSERMQKLIDDFQQIHLLAQSHNKAVVKSRLDANQDFFDHCLAYPLDQQQRRSIVSEEDNCLVVSSAGSGKTSSIVGKVKYLTERRNVVPKNILLISYTNKAAAELTVRMGVAGLRGYTFHKLALDLISKTTGIKPSICENTDALFVEIYRELLDDNDFRKGVLEYFIDYQVQEDDLERRKKEQLQSLAEQKASKLKALLPDMDGKTVYVRSKQEQKICFALSALGLKFRYEEPYEHPVANEMYSQYRPDFSIYYEKDGCLKRIYLEHFAVDEHGLVPLWFAEDKGITYEEANQKYGDGITWKKEVHKKFGTKLLSTSSADFHYYDIREKLREMFSEAGVQTTPKSDKELYDLMLQKDSRREKAFIRLCATFTVLLKSSCKTIEELLSTVEDDRSKFIIKNIFHPIINRYAEALKQKGQIDFTDAIIQATQICNNSHPVAYDYIIVDEFQDISVDRYYFLKALRDSNPPAKLYCVGDDWQSIYRFSGSDMALFNQFADYFGPTEINKIETTYRFGEPLVGLSSQFIQRNKIQIAKNIRPFNKQLKTELKFIAYEQTHYCDTIAQAVASIPADKSVFLLGRYSFDDYYLSRVYKSFSERGRFYYVIGNRKIEFLTVHKSKGLEADYVIVLQCNKDGFGFPSKINDDPVLDYVLTKSDQYPFGEERRLFYVAITRAKNKTMVLYDQRCPSVFVDEFLNPERVSEVNYIIHPNANKRWTQSADNFLLSLHREGKSIRYIAEKMGRSQTSIIMRLGKLGAR